MGHLDDSEDIELHLSSDEEVNRKEEFDADIPHKERHLREKELLSQDGGQKLGGPVEDTAGTVLHVCQICHEVFAQRDLLKAHVIHVHLNKVMQFTCEFCSELFERKHDLARHITLVHAVKKKHQCSYISKLLALFVLVPDKKTKIIRRCLVLENKRTERKFFYLLQMREYRKFNLQLRRYIWSSTLRDMDHNMDNQEGNSTETIVKIEEMDVEEQEVVEIPASQGSMDQNMGIQEVTSLEAERVVLSNDNEASGSPGVDLVADSGQKQGGPVEDAPGTALHVCQICSKVFAQRDLLKDHVIHVHLNKVMKFRCKICSELFERKNDLARHIKLVHAVKKKHQCELCSRNFLYLSQLKTHNLSHTGEKPLRCALFKEALRYFGTKNPK
ncbi:GDNF-inducible zinc finger protein 1-like [Hetaerina americana]|uniref:GDNF-inducible zinc finger protein 1-like n=1 Tax=Hetaerina americana TaxID=62018 RepID=UPI003A7F5519